MVEIRTFGRKATNKGTPEGNAELLKKMRKEHDKPVKGMFEFIDAQGGWIEFGYRVFKGEDPMTIKLVHGEICELPMGIVKHLNNTKKKIRKFKADLDAAGKMSEHTVVSRLRFTPMDVI